MGTGEALLNIRAKGGPAGQADGKGAATSVSTAQEFDFQSELQKFDKVKKLKLGNLSRILAESLPESS